MKQLLTMMALEMKQFSLMKELLDILYHPAGYIHPDRLPEGWVNTGTSSHPLLNRWIVMKYCTLSTIDNGWYPDAVNMTFLKYWHVLPSAAYFIGAKLLHARLLENGQYLRLDEALQEFIKLPLPPLTSSGGAWATVSNHKLSGEALLVAGGKLLLSAMKTLPDALYQRALLLFPLSEVVIDKDFINDINSSNLINMAINYAQHFTIESRPN